MKKAYLQYWEESVRNLEVLPDGCSLHCTIQDRNNYVKSIYSNRSETDVPHEYDRIVGDAIEVEVCNSLWDQILEEGNSLRLMQHSLSNLKALEEIKIIFEDEFDY